MTEGAPEKVFVFTSQYVPWCHILKPHREVARKHVSLRPFPVSSLFYQYVTLNCPWNVEL